MGHCISIYLINKSELRDDKISSVLNKKTRKQEKIKWIELEEGILATTHIPNHKEFDKNKRIAKITTDYFSGLGSQQATIRENKKVILDLDDEFIDSGKYDLHPINKALRRIGVIRKDGMDEFDTIGLGYYRSNSDFDEKI